MEVDHLLPERLLDDTKAKSEAISSFALPQDFDLNSFANWLPAHATCNNKKRGHVFRPTPLIQIHVDRARERASKAKSICENSVQGRKIDRALGVLATAENPPPADLLDALVQHYATANSTPQVVGHRIEAGGPSGTIGLATMKPILKYTPPHRLELAPGLTIVFDQTAKESEAGPFTYKTTED